MWTYFQFACDPPVVRMQITGEIDFANAGQLRDQFQCFFRWHCTQVELDLSELTFIDLACLRILDSEQRRFEELGGNVEVVAASPCYCRITDLIGYRNLQPSRMSAAPALALVPTAADRA